MYSEVLKFVEITYTVCLPLALTYIIRLIKSNKIDKKETIARMEQVIADINGRMDNISKKLEDHIADSLDRDIRQRRIAILDFANSVLNKRNHTREEYEFMMSECDNYENYCEKHQIKNGVAEVSFGVIRDSYRQHLENHDFLPDDKPEYDYTNR